ncbi:pentatricopeptide repeat-containing protein At4g14850 isoform X2 [Lactuca sativa]|uniref:pentatricopeptide repeat-containing protein At4g14850 isoform X2 n=1 Tax=Lactuca sativa TaxID=4236 RepID=UPI000CD9954D|nr:pentatricopeptide repeat-containing protein At4g14850 isoform X2 [Lactuca sativa]
MTFRMLTKHLQKHSNTLAHIIQTYTQSKQLSNGKLLHAQLITSGYPSSTYLINHLLSMYARCGQLGYAHRLFDEMPQRNLVSWTAMISAFSQNSEFAKAITTFCGMCVFGESPNQFAFSSVIQACSSLKSVQIGKQIHCLALKVGFSYELFVGSNLADMYSKCGSIIEACMVFEEMPSKDEVSWNSMINGYAKNGYNEEALVSFKKMLTEDVTIDQHLLCSILCVCGPLKTYNIGRSLHSFVTKLGFEQHISVGNALMDMYCKLGDMDSASQLLNINSKGTNIISYTSLIDGYVESDQIEKAFTIFIELKRQRIEPNEFTFSSLIKSCANHATLEQGVQLHALVLKYNLDQDPFVSSIIVDMYGKCGLLDHSLQAFEKISKPNEYTWNSLIGVFAHHGLGHKAIDVFEKMLLHDIKPNSVTFINLLNACSHSGLLTEGLSYFNSMETIYGVKPKSEHYSCVIDLLGRSGKLKEAENFIKSMPFEANAYAWCSFLASCRKYGDKERGELASKSLKIIDPLNSGAHVLLSNIYAKEQQWEDVKSVRKMMKDENVKKLKGCSWVDVDKRVHVFGVEDLCHGDKKEIDLKLDELLRKIIKIGYVPDVDSVPFDLDYDMKVKILNHHSERIAIAYALIRMPIGKPIIVKKNLRVCVDCHSAIKLMSKVEGREIILRDNSRFHHFVDGSCSCKDFCETQDQVQQPEQPNSEGPSHVDFDTKFLKICWRMKVKDYFLNKIRLKLFLF